MDHMIRSGLATLVVGVLACLPSAFAACPADSVTRASDLFASSERPGADVSALSGQANAISAACPDNPEVNRVLVNLHGNLTLKASAPSDAQAQTVLAWRAYRAMVKSGVSYANGDLAKAIIDLMAQAEALTGKPSEFSRAVRPGDPAASCELADYSLATYYGLAIPANGRPDWKIVLAMLDRNIAACEGKVAPQDLVTLLAQSAQIRVEALQNKWTPAPDDRIATAAVAKAHLQRAFQLRPDGVSLLLMKPADRRQMDEFLMGVLPPVPEAEWFLPENADSVYVQRSIAMLIDAAWAEDKGQFTGQKAYAEIGRLEKLARAQSDPKAARRLVWLAAQGHSLGRFRRPENVGLKPTPEYYWNWINPDYRPPAQ